MNPSRHVEIFENPYKSLYFGRFSWPQTYPPTCSICRPISNRYTKRASCNEIPQQQNLSSLCRSQICFRFVAICSSFVYSLRGCGWTMDPNRKFRNGHKRRREIAYWDKWSVGDRCRKQSFIVLTLGLFLWL